MSRQHAHLDPERLMLAVDAIFFAFEQVVDEGRPLRHPLDLYGAPDQPVSLADFTRHEVREASRFLERLGVLGPRRRRRGRGRGGGFGRAA